MRVFIAIDIGEEIRKALGNLQQQLQREFDIKEKSVRWVKPGSIHLTLKFLGEVKDKDIIQLCDIIKEVAESHKDFEIDIESVGHFGGRSARVLWVGTGSGSERLCQLQSNLEDKLVSAGWRRENREFTGHLTLCRIKNSKAGYQLAKATERYKDFKLGSILVDSLKLYQSQLTPQGPIYTVLGNYKLR